MPADDQALSRRDEAPAVVVDPQWLRPMTRTREMMLVLGGYLGLLIPATFIGLGTQMMVVFAMFAFAMHRRRAWFRSVALQREIQTALAGDDVNEAARLGRRLLTNGPRFGLAHALAVASWGVIELRRGRPEAAIEVLQRALKSGRFAGRTGRIVEAWRIVAALAYAHAVAGDITSARTQLAEAEATLASAQHGALMAIRVYILCRQDHTQAAVKLFDTQWRTAEPMLTVGGARTARMLEAFALEHAAHDEYRSGVGERTTRALDRAREASRGAYDYLAVHWPELRDFLRRHQLTDATSDAVAP